MNKRSWICPLLDGLGVFLIASAAVALTTAFWYTGGTVEPAAFNLFHGCLGLAIASFFSSRLIDISTVLVNTPDPRTLRAHSVGQDVAAADSAVAEPDSSGNVTTGKFSRAA